MEDSADKPKYLDGKSVLTAIAVQQGILVERAEDIYSFSHLTVQEYLTSQYLSQNIKQLEEDLKRFLHDNRWQEIFLLVSGLLPNSKNFLQMMIDVAQSKVNHLKLQSLFSWANSVTSSSQSDISQSAKRIIAIMFVLMFSFNFKYSHMFKFEFESLNNSFIFHLISNPKDIEELDNIEVHRMSIITLACKLSSLLGQVGYQYSYSLHQTKLQIDLRNNLSIFNNSTKFNFLINEFKLITFKGHKANDSYKAYKKFFERQKYIWNDCFNIDDNLLNLSATDIMDLTDYLYICELVVRCKESAVRVSREVWESIEDAIVMPKSKSEL